MEERPILFNSEMVRGILAGDTTQTRRVVKPQPNTIRWCPVQNSKRYDGWEDEHGKPYPCPYGKPGDTLWVRETWNKSPDCFGMAHYKYKADLISNRRYTWKPSIHMPRSASRITLEITNVRVERLQEISVNDCDAEMFGGDFPNNIFPQFHFTGHMSIPECFAIVWDSINAKRGYPWDNNPLVWAIEFVYPNLVREEY